MVLQKQLKRFYSGTRGFTLVELLVVVAIIAILAAIAIPQFLAYRERGIRASMVADARNTATQLEAYFVDNSSYLGANGDAAAAGAAWGVIDGRTSTGNSGLIASTATTWTATITNAVGATIALQSTGACAAAGFTVAALNGVC